MNDFSETALPSVQCVQFTYSSGQFSLFHILLFYLCIFHEYTLLCLPFCYIWMLALFIYFSITKGSNRIWGKFQKADDKYFKTFLGILCSCDSCLFQGTRAVKMFPL